MNVYEEAIKHYGPTAQKLMIIEEMSELSKEICKDFRGKLNIEHMTEELADVMIMMRQAQLLYGIKDFDLAKVIDVKLQRLKSRMAAEDAE